MNGSQEPTSVIEYVKAARALISDEKNWCQKALGEERNGNIAYCAIGTFYAIDNKLKPAFRLGGTLYYMPVDFKGVCPLATKAAMELGKQAGSLAHFNNSHTHQEVLQLFDDTIARLEEQEYGKDIEIAISRRNSTGPDSTKLLQQV